MLDPKKVWQRGQLVRNHPMTQADLGFPKKPWDKKSTQKGVVLFEQDLYLVTFSAQYGDASTRIDPSNGYCQCVLTPVCVEKL
jgi:hypothetical protein